MTNRELNFLLVLFKNQLSQQDTFVEGKITFIHTHRLLFSKEMSEISSSYESEILDGIYYKYYALAPIFYKKTIAYYLYHSTRIEDIVSNLLISDTEQIFFKHNYQEKMNSSISTTGNELDFNQIIDFSKSLDINELRKYRIDVGRNTEEIIKNLQYNDLKRKVSKERINKILEQKSISTNKEAIWLLDYWQKKTVLGLLLMPMTRHHIMHLNDCSKIVDYLRRRVIANDKI